MLEAVGGKIVVTADDFGSSRTVNEAVEIACREGILTSASLIVTGPAFGDAVARARRLPELSTGLHLVFCDGRPAATDPAAARLARRGKLPRSPLVAGLRYYVGRRRLAPALTAEVRAQFARLKAAGLAIHHVDGHHHLHMHPVLLPLVLEAMREFGVPHVRLVREDGAGRVRMETPAAEVVAAIFWLLARRYRSSAIATTERVYGLRATGRLDELALIRLIRRLRAPTVEVYTHPDTATAAGRAELEALCSPRVRAALSEAGYRLVGTRDLAPRPGGVPG